MWGALDVYRPFLQASVPTPVRWSCADTFTRESWPLKKEGPKNRSRKMVAESQRDRQEMSPEVERDRNFPL